MRSAPHSPSGRHRPGSRYMPFSCMEVFLSLPYHTSFLPGERRWYSASFCRQTLQKGVPDIAPASPFYVQFAVKPGIDPEKCLLFFLCVAAVQPSMRLIQRQHPPGSASFKRRSVSRFSGTPTAPAQTRIPADSSFLHCSAKRGTVVISG